MSLTAQRSKALEQLATRRFDLLVIGGGITGAGIALDAAARGLKVALIDQSDFAAGTSSKSSKLIHGGLRYLENREFGLMQEAASERDLLRRIAPHLVTPLGFFWPEWAGAGRKAKAGLWVYDILAGFRNISRHRTLPADEAALLAPGCRRGDGYLFYDSETDDARLVLAILEEARRFGATIANYCRAEDLLDVGGRVVGCRAREVSGEEIEIRAGDVVNATGVWADDICLLEDESVERRLRPSKGMHILLPRSVLPLKTALLLPAPDRRLVFAAPWRSSVIVGTTDTEYSGPLDAPTVTEDEVGYMLAAVSRSFEADFQPAQVSGAYAGLRPLLRGEGVEKTRDLSRRHAVFRGPKGLVTVTGGKLTTYRRMAEEVVDLITKRQGRFVKSLTRNLRLGIANIDSLREAVKQQVADMQLDPEVGESLVRSYGNSALRVLALARDEDLASPLVDGLPYLEAEVVWGLRAEMAVNVSDLLSRRTRISLEDRSGGLSAETRIRSLVSAELGLHQDDADTEINEYATSLARERGPAIPTSAALT